MDRCALMSFYVRMRRFYTENDQKNLVEELCITNRQAVNWLISLIINLFPVIVSLYSNWFSLCSYIAITLVVSHNDIVNALNSLHWTSHFHFLMYLDTLFLNDTYFRWLPWNHTLNHLCLGRHCRAAYMKDKTKILESFNY